MPNGRSSLRSSLSPSLAPAQRSMSADAARPRAGPSGPAAHADRCGLDSQSVRTTERGAARLRRRHEGQRPKRHPLADTLGLLLAVHLSPANLSDRDGAVRAVATAVSATPAAAAAWLGGQRLPRRVPGLSAGEVQDRLRGGGTRRWWTAAPMAAARSGAASGPTVRGPPTQVGGGADPRLAGPLPPLEQGPRVPPGDLRGGHPPGDDPAAGPPASQQMTFSDTL
jgi:hypothetical protein